MINLTAICNRYDYLFADNGKLPIEKTKNKLSIK